MLSSRNRRIFAFGAIVLGTVASIAASEDARAVGAEKLVTLQWTASPEECPDGAYVQIEIARLLGGPEVTEADAHIKARAKVIHVGDGAWRVELVTEVEGSGKKGVRKLDAGSCRAIADATALILAMAVNPTRVAQAASSASASAVPSTVPSVIPSVIPSASPPPVPSASAPPVPTVTAPPTLVASPPAERVTPIAWTLGGSAIVDLGSFPSIAPGLGVTFGTIIDRLRLELAGVWMPRSRATLEGRPTAGATFELLSVGARLGWVVSRPFELTPVVGLELARIRASGFGVDVPNDGSTGRTAFSIGAIAAHRLVGALAVRGSIEALLPTRRTEFVLDSGVVHREPTVVGRAMLGLELRL